MANASLYLALYFLHAQLSVPWSLAALPALAVVPILRCGATCSRLLQVPTAVAPLQQLFSGLALLQ